MLQGLGDLQSVYKALGNETRLKILVQIDEGKPVSGVADDISRSGLQKHVEVLIDAELVYRPVESGRSYRLTALGQVFLEKVRQDKVVVDDLLHDYRTRYEKLCEEKADVFESMEDADVDTSELEEKISAEVWDSLEVD